MFPKGIFQSDGEISLVNGWMRRRRKYKAYETKYASKSVADMCGCQHFCFANCMQYLGRFDLSVDYTEGAGEKDESYPNGAGGIYKGSEKGGDERF